MDIRYYTSFDELIDYGKDSDFKSESFMYYNIPVTYIDDGLLYITTYDKKYGIRPNEYLIIFNDDTIDICDDEIFNKYYRNNLL